MRGVARERLEIAVASLGVGIALIALAEAQWRFGWPMLGVQGAYLALAAVVLAVMRFSARAVVLTWIGAVISVTLILVGVDGWVWAVFAAGLLFGTLAVVPWLTLSAGVLALIRHARGRAPDDDARAPRSPY